ncbi:MAG: sugar phosphate nucleotidyltransferase [Candidatus Omnitrophota bacterium]|nr:NTP transferase domain-containing protein [Candidatus Omnitrophota bacterium]MBU1894665.1 NTP transferase domain-containing protein [Candidatus Omnitrophota bacterium]
MNNITAVILSAGLGTRMRTRVPKVLHLVGSKTILRRIIDNLKASGITNIAAVVGYKAESIERSFKSEIELIRQDQLLGSGDALAQAINYIKDAELVLVTCGDAPLISADTFLRVIEKHIKEKAACTILTCNMPNPYSYGRIVREKTGTVIGIIEEKDATPEEKNIKEVNAGTYCFCVNGLKEFIKQIKINEKKKEFYLTDIVDILAKNNKKISAETCNPEEVIGINSRKDLAEVNDIINKKTLNKLMDSGVTIISPESTYIDEDAIVGKDTIIFPNTVIEGDVEIAEECRIGPFARIRSGSRISFKVEIGNFVEICRTKIGEGTRVKHHAYLGDAVVGNNVNIGAGVITANYDGEKKNITIIDDNVFVGVGSIFIAPVKIGKNAKIGAGSVVTKNKDVPDGAVVMGVPAKPYNA